MKNQTCRNCGHDKDKHDFLDNICMEYHCPCSKFEAEDVLSEILSEGSTGMIEKPQKGEVEDKASRIIEERLRKDIKEGKDKGHLGVLQKTTKRMWQDICVTWNSFYLWD